ncbi:MAG: DMT family transporter [Bacteroidales bacterium]
MKINKGFVYLLVLASMIFWGFSFVWTSIVFKYIGPLTTVFLRLIISSSLLYIGLKLGKRLQPIRKEHRKLIMLSALFNPFLYFLGESFGVKFSSPTISAVIIATIPVFSALAAFIHYKEKFHPINILGFILSFAGVLILLLGPNLSFNTSPLGVACLFFAVLTAVAYALALKKLAGLYSAFTIVTIQNILGAIYFLPLVLLFERHHLMNLPTDADMWRPLLMLAVFASSLAFIFFTIGTRELGVSRTNVFSNFIPVFTALFAWLLVDEKITIGKIAGMLMVTTGVLLTQMSRIRIFESYLLKYRKP